MSKAPQSTAFRPALGPAGRDGRQRRSSARARTERRKLNSSSPTTEGGGGDREAPHTAPHPDQQAEMEGKGGAAKLWKPEGKKRRNPTSRLQPAKEGEGRKGEEERRKNREAPHTTTHSDHHAEMRGNGESLKLREAGTVKCVGENRPWTPKDNVFQLSILERKVEKGREVETDTNSCALHAKNPAHTHSAYRR